MGDRLQTRQAVFQSRPPLITDTSKTGNLVSRQKITKGKHYAFGERPGVTSRFSLLACLPPFESDAGGKPESFLVKALFMAYLNHFDGAEVAGKCR